MRHIAIIDDGVNEKYFKNDIVLRNNVEITKDLEIIDRTNYNKYAFSHGTICAGIIAKYGIDIELSSVKILNSNYTGLCEQLIKAITWCVENSVHIVNMSLGTSKWEDYLKLKPVISRATNRNVIFVAANNNKGLITYPAAMSSVLGIRAGVGTQVDVEEFSYNESAFNGIEIESNGNHILDLYDGSVISSGPSNSFAAAFATSVISQIADTNKTNSLKILRSYLSEHFHLRHCVPCYTFRHFDWVEKVLIFNFCKENLRGADLIPMFTECCIEANNLEDFADMCAYILQYLQDNFKVLESSNTIIVISDCKYTHSSDNAFSALCSFLNVYKIHLLFLDENIRITNQSLFASYTSRISCYNDYCYNNHIIHDNVYDGPVISVYDFSNEYVLDILGNLLLLFRESGYDVTGVTNNKLAVLLGMEYIKLDNGHILEDANFIYKVGAMHNADIMVNGVAVDISFFDNIKNYNMHINEDIILFVFNNLNEVNLRQIEHNFVNSKIIVLYKNNQCKCSCNFLFDVSKINYKSLFRHIINSFEKG